MRRGVVGRVAQATLRGRRRKALLNATSTIGGLVLAFLDALWRGVYAPAAVLLLGQRVVRDRGGL